MSDYQVTPAIKQVFADLLQETVVRQGMAFIEKDQDLTLQEQKEMVVIEAPTFHEEKRSQDYAERFKALGLTDVHIDAYGNVLGTRKGTGKGPTILLEAHLDTVFDFGTDVTPVEKDGKIYAPGICDDTRGLAANLSVLRALQESGIETVGDLIFAGTVAEEGLGGMQGMRKLLEQHPEIDATVSIDGGGIEKVVYEATGICNYDVTYHGPGGHAYGAFGLPSPLQAAGRAIAKLSDMRPPKSPKTTFTVSLFEGGHQIHAIAMKANFKINMRSDNQAELDQLQEQAIACFEAGAKEENARWDSDAVTVEYQRILNVPAGSQDVNSTIVQAAWVATECVGVDPILAKGGCTNTNQPVHMGIPAVTLPRGGNEGGIHSLAEWFDPEGVYRASQKSFLLLLALAGMKDVNEPLITTK